MLTQRYRSILRILKQNFDLNQIRFHSAESLIRTYDATKAICRSKKLPKDVNIAGVFACNELDLKEVNIYGFDYDYTLALYKPTMDYLLYNLGRQILIEQYKYPKEIGKLEYIPDFAIRDSIWISLQGLTALSTEEVLKLYKNRIIPIVYVEGNLREGRNSNVKMIQLADLFSVPEMGLLCNVTDYFEKKHIDYHPEILFRDVQDSLFDAHLVMHKIVPENVSYYLEPNKKLRAFFDRLKAANKKLFVVTNSPFKFVDKGMEFLVGPDWKEYFDVIIVQARKPRFFTDASRPIRIYDQRSGIHIWDRVTKLQKGIIYYEGTVKQLQELTGWRGHQVLYYGDHPYSDLADVTLEHGWRTGAIIPELTHEINTLNNAEFKENANWLHMLTQLIEDHQDCESPEEQQVLAKWMAERDDLRHKIKIVFNAQFGSVFRTYHNPSYFSRRLFRFADIYTSNITNLMKYSVNHTFYPRRGVMPHEYISYFV